MAREKVKDKVNPILFTENGGNDGTIILRHTRNLYVNQKIKLKSDTLDIANLEIKIVMSETEIKVGPINTPLHNFFDVSSMLLADNANLSADSQTKPVISPKDSERGSFEEAPIVAKRVINVDTLGNHYSESNPLITQFPNQNYDAFGRQRISQPFAVFEAKSLFSKNGGAWEEDINGIGASIDYLPNESSVQLGIGTVSGEFAIRQTTRYFAYVPGKSHSITMTGLLGEKKTNVVSRLGYFDDENGIYFEQNENDTVIVRRSKVTGSIINTVIPQSDWSVDPLDGTGPSKIILDPTKVQIFQIDFQWLGTGKVRVGLNINGLNITCHEFNHANMIETVYMSTPTLPVRYEIRNIGLSPSNSSMKEICVSVVSEGGYTLPGFEFSASSGITTRAATTTRTPVFAIRLKNSFSGKLNRRTARLIDLNTYIATNNAHIELVHIHNPSAITATWNSAGADSAIEYSTDISAIGGALEHVVDGFFGIAGSANKGTTTDKVQEFINNHSYISQNMASDNSQIFVVYATSFASTANIGSHLTWVEFD